MDLFYDERRKFTPLKNVYSPAVLTDSIQDLARDLSTDKKFFSFGEERCEDMDEYDAYLTVTGVLLDDYEPADLETKFRLYYCQNGRFIRNQFNKQEISAMKRLFRRPDLEVVYVEPDGFGLGAITISADNIKGKHLKKTVDLLLSADLRTFQSSRQCEEYLDALQKLLKELEKVQGKREEEKKSKTVKAVERKYKAAGLKCLSPEPYREFYLEEDIGGIPITAKSARRGMRQSSGLTPKTGYASRRPAKKQKR